MYIATWKLYILLVKLKKKEKGIETKYRKCIITADGVTRSKFDSVKIEVPEEEFEATEKLNRKRQILEKMVRQCPWIDRSNFEDGSETPRE